MAAGRRFTVMGFMSGTSMAGIDAAILETDADWLPAAEVDLEAIELIGFHGRTIRHDPEHRKTWQLGEGQRLADALGCVVIDQFRQNDLEHGGQGAPLAPAYHRALVRATGLTGPVAVLNIGGVSNITLSDGELFYACDCGPGNALIDDWVSRRFGVPFDEDGRKAAAGQVDSAALDRRNRQLLAQLRCRLGTAVKMAEEVGWPGDAIEAQAFGYLAVRSALKWPLSWPETTGVATPVSGGIRREPKSQRAARGT